MIASKITLIELIITCIINIILIAYLAKGKKNYDKRESIAKKDQQREAAKDFKIRNLG